MDEFVAESGEPPRYLVKGLLYAKSYTELYGQPGAGKTFMALDLAYHIAAGKEWHGRKVNQGPVLYLPYEGRGGLGKRIKALRQHYQATGVPLFIAEGGPNLRTPQGQEAFIETLKQLPAKPAMIVIDTFAHALMGGDENSAQDVGAFNAAVQGIIKLTEACVLLIHHPTKAGGTARGSGALLGALDAELEIEEGKLVARKQRDVELGEAIGFKLQPVPLGLDDDGDEVTSCVVVPAAIAKRSARVSGAAQKALVILETLRPNNEPITREQWKQACIDEEACSVSRARQWFSECRLRLKTAGCIVEDENGLITRRLQ
jgi:RecA/RadA recombinase